MIEVLSCSSIHHGISHASSSPHSVSVGLPALAGRGKEQIPEGSMPDGSSIIHKLDEPSMGESGFSRRLPPLGGSGLQHVFEPHIDASRFVSRAEAACGSCTASSSSGLVNAKSGRAQILITP